MSQFYENLYNEISSSLNLNFSGDGESAEMLSRYRNFSTLIWQRLGRYSGRDFLVLGNARSTINTKDIEEFLTGKILVVADSAIDMLPSWMVPHIVVSDLDGNMDRILECVMQGTSLFVHAHGDNMDKIRKFVPELEGMFIPTTQVPGQKGIYNPEGFTDGDRAVRIASDLGASEMMLLGFDFSNPTGKGNLRMKSNKLAIARRIIENELKQGAKIRRFPDTFL